MQTFELTEDRCVSRPSRVDRISGILEDVKIVGLSSPSKRREYSPHGLKEAIGLYEGAKVNIDHHDSQTKSRKFEERIGRLEGIYFKDGQGLFAKRFRFNPKHPAAESLCWWAENDPAGVGFSQIAKGKGRYTAGTEIIESIHSVQSVDLVADPATTTGLFESEGMEEDSELNLAEAYSEHGLSRKSLAALAACYSDTPGSITSTELAESQLTQAEAEAAGIEVIDLNALALKYRD